MIVGGVVVDAVAAAALRHDLWRLHLLLRPGETRKTSKKKGDEASKAAAKQEEKLDSDQVPRACRGASAAIAKKMRAKDAGNSLSGALMFKTPKDCRHLVR